MSLLQPVFQLLIFRISRAELLRFDRRHFWVGLLGTWIVGMGRYWDDPGAHLLQHLGLGSVIYIFGLSLLIWLVILPFQVEKWTYFRVLTFVSLTSFPAVFYAIPVERFMSVELAAAVNAWFLAIVAAWRLALLFFFLRRFSQLRWWYIVVGALLPVCAIIAALTALNLERAVFDIMGGIRDATSNDRAYGVLVFLTFSSALLFIPLVIGYVVAIFQRRRRLRRTSLENQVES
ncbi:MAG: hypothetical protein AAFR61_26820 [Bacteroidota bacterium]